MAEDRHKYEYSVGLDAGSGPARVVRIVGTNKRVLEVGSGPGSITKILAEMSRCRVTALDIDLESITRIAPYCEGAYQADLNDPAWPQVLKDNGKFEVVVAADVLEHVYEPLRVLKSMKELLDDGGYAVVSLPHIGHSGIHACLLDENFEYGDFGLLDRTHIRFFGIKNIQKLFTDAGMKIVHAEFVVRRPEHTEFAAYWSKLSPEIRQAISANPFGSVYQVIVKAVPDAAEGAGISLLELPVERAVPTGRDSIKAIVRKGLGENIYLKLRLLAAKLGVKYKG